MHTGRKLVCATSIWKSEAAGFLRWPAVESGSKGAEVHMSDSVQPALGVKEAMRLTKARLCRLTWALETYGHLIADAVRGDSSMAAREAERLPVDQIPEHVARSISDVADPTKPKTMTGWLIKQYAEGRLRLEDLGSANDTLTMFEKHSKKLPKGTQDLGQYQSLAAVWEAVIAFANDEEQHLSGKAQKALDRDKAYTESRILRQDPDGFTVAVPLTDSAAKWWGKGTRWCTAAEKDNAFLEYHEEAPLIVIVLPWLGAKGKFQLWCTKDEAQFMDAADEPVSKNAIAKHWPLFRPLFQHLLHANGRLLELLPDDLRDEELCTIAVKEDGGSLFCVPAALRTERLCEAAATENSIALRHTPKELMTADFLCRVVSKNSKALQDIPPEFLSTEMCTRAVENDGRLLQHVPIDWHTLPLCEAAVRQDGVALQHVPKCILTPQLCEIAVRQNGFALRHVPNLLRGEQVCRMAVAQEGLALEFVPWDLRTRSLCNLATRVSPASLHFVPPNLRTYAFCLKAIQRLAEIEPDAAAGHFMALPYFSSLIKLLPVKLVQDLALAPPPLNHGKDISSPGPGAYPFEPRWDEVVLDELAMAISRGGMSRDEQVCGP